MSGLPLDGIRVLDLSQALAGPYATALLADMGADVIKVEPPAGDHFRALGGGAIALTVNRNKRGVVIDLKTHDGRRDLERLASSADVFIESFVPGVIDRLGFGHERVREIKPDVVYVSISGFGQTGPYRDLPGYDVVAQAMSGIMAATGETDGPPVRTGASMIDVSTGLYACIAILTALRDRERTGTGHRIELSLHEVAVSLVPHFFAAYSMTGSIRKRQGSVADLGCPYQNFATADGWVFIGCTSNRHWQSLCRELGREELASDERFATTSDRLANRAAVVEELAPLFAVMTSAGATALAWRAHIPSGPVLAVDEVMKDPHLIDRDIWGTIEDPERGPITYPRNAIRWDGSWFTGARPAPRLGEHNEELLGPQ